MAGNCKFALFGWDLSVADTCEYFQLSLFLFVN